MAQVMPIAVVGAAGQAGNALMQTAAAGHHPGSFGELMMAGLRDIDAKVSRADALIQAFAQGDAVPVHQVTLALEEARLSVELAMQVRTRLVETYRDFMTMQI